MPDAPALSAPLVASAAPLLPIRVRAKFFFEGARKWFIKGVTYGPFAPDAAGDFVGDPEKARRDFALMAEMGINLLRIYHVPPRWFLDLAREFRLRVLISIPWAEHIEFLNNGKIRRQIEETIRAGVAKNAGHEAIFGYYVGNEIPFAIVRWLGAQHVIEFVEKLIRIARAADPRALFSFASYPPTEFLLPSNVDFVSYNVYLERQRDFEKYLARLQNLAEDKPLVFGEFGMDTIRKGEDEQASVLTWHLESVVRGGAAPKMLAEDEHFQQGAFEAENDPDHETVDLSEIRASVEAVITSPVGAQVAQLEVVRARPRDTRAARAAEARMKGFEGDNCGACGNFTLVRNGTCMKCNTCGSTSGCS